MRQPDWEMTQGDAFPLITIDLTGIDGEPQALGDDDTATFEYQRSGGRGEATSVEAEILQRTAPAKLRAPALSASTPVGRYDSWFRVVFATGAKPLTWPNDGAYFGRVYPGPEPEVETSP